MPFRNFHKHNYAKLADAGLPCDWGVHIDASDIWKTQYPICNAR